MKKFLCVKKESGNEKLHIPKPRRDISGIANNFSSNHKREKSKE